jgi:TetR/AcrR family transcriptional regulator
VGTVLKTPQPAATAATSGSISSRLPTAESSSTRDRIISAAMTAFGSDGFHATSLDALAAKLGVTKQTILHHFGSKDGVLAATTEAAAVLLSDAVDMALLKPGEPDERLVRVVHGIFSLAARRPELLGFVRDLSRLGSTPLANLRVALAPFLDRASTFVAEEMFTASASSFGSERPKDQEQQLSELPRSGIAAPSSPIRQSEALDVVLAGYAAVLAAAAEVEVLRSLGVTPSGRLFLRRRREVIEYLRSLSGTRAASAEKTQAGSSAERAIHRGTGR